MSYVSKPSIVSRSSWGAAATKAVTQLPKAKVTKLVIHHTASNNTTVTNSTEIAHQKALQTDMMNRGYQDMGYHFGIGKNGSILEGRLTSLQGEHVSNHNNYTLGITLHGDYETRAFTTAQLNSLCNLLAWLCYDYGLTTSAITYHQALSSTACPGANVISKMSTIRSNVYNLLNNGPIGS